ncbi:MAG TPA: VWA domain-containing protein, partial [Chitinophagaceae bacterium]|nr:VWA domain-containing protein [Chitinophagaceae bacterium]
MNRIRTISSGKGILFFLLCTFVALKSRSQCGQDIYIANDQSGSVDSRENMQSRQFIEQLALAFPLGNANTESRIAISSWGWTNEFQQYNFPSAGVGYTTSLSDIVSYRNSPKPFNGGTDPYVALLKAYQNINLTPVAGRNVPKLIILMTDAYSYQVNSNIISLANLIKAAGYKILVLGVDAASLNPPQPILQAVASPGLNFTASSYDALINNAVGTVQQAIAQICPVVTPPFDLTVAINSFDCNTGDVSYTVSNTGGQSFGPATLNVSFYNGDPRNSTTRLFFTHSEAGVTINAGFSHVVSLTAATMQGLGYTSLQGIGHLYAVVNLNTTGNNAAPPLPTNLTS